MNASENFTQEQAEEVAAELFQRAAEVTRQTLDPEPEPILGAIAPEPVTMLTPEGVSELESDKAVHEHTHIEPTKITRKQWGEYMRAMFTIHNFTMPCGHKLATARNDKGETYLPSDPKTNCQLCWFLYFQNNGNMTQIADQCFQEAGRDVLERSRGKKFVKYFLMFMSTMARFQREQAAAEAAKGASDGSQDNNETATGGPSGSDRGDSTTDSSEPGFAGEAQEIGGIPADSGRGSGGPETAPDGGSPEGFGTGSESMQQGLGD